MNGKILFFNANDGNGIIITADKQKLNFTVQEWDDFEVMPSLGLEVGFSLNEGAPTNITALENSTHLQENEYLPEDEDEPQQDEPQQEQQEEPQEAEEEPTPDFIEEETATHHLYEEEVVKPQPKNLETPTKTQEEEQKEEFFKEEPEITEILEDVEEELPPREESVTVTMNVHRAVDNYFQVIEENIERRKFYRKVEGRLDYLLIRRFLWTIFNNLCEIDLHILTPQLKTLATDLRAMARVYDDFTRKTRQPKLAYEEVFLSCQAEYMKIKEGTELTVERIQKLKNNEKYVGSVRKIKKELLEKTIDTEEFSVLKDELKSLNGAYVDTVHMMAELDERYKHDMKLLKEFEKEYRDDFYALFSNAAKKYKSDFIDILSAQAYLLDEKLWNKAKVSKAVKSHFQKSSIVGEFNTRTYLKYYLKSFTSDNMSEETKKLSDLYDYLCSLHKEYALIVVKDPQDAMEYESSVRVVDKSIHTSIFVDEKKALQWAIKNSVKVLVLEDRLTHMSVDTFLKNYKKHVLSIPSIIIIGEKPKINDYSITKLLKQNTSSLLIARNIQELYYEEIKKSQEKKDS